MVWKGSASTSPSSSSNFRCASARAGRRRSCSSLTLRSGMLKTVRRSSRGDLPRGRAQPSGCPCPALRPASCCAFVVDSKGWFQVATRHHAKAINRAWGCFMTSRSTLSVRFRQARGCSRRAISVCVWPSARRDPMARSRGAFLRRRTSTDLWPPLRPRADNPEPVRASVLVLRTCS